MLTADPRLLELGDEALEQLALRLRRTCNALQGMTTEAGRRTLADYEGRLAAVEMELERRLI